uniref:Uncharacterized protein n=1 Tax=Glossina palpalis gambiensis TaxID=67801 RepID=A0A1B0C6U8_9MUSC
MYTVMRSRYMLLLYLPTSILKIFSGIMLAELHNLLSKLLREYPDLWRPRRASQKGLYEELARRLSEKLNYRVTITRLISTLQGIRKAIIKLEEGSSHTTLTAYAWYAEELGYKKAAATMRRHSRRQSHGPKRARLIEEVDFVPVHAEGCDSPPMSAQSKFAGLTEKYKIVQIHFDEVYTNHATVYSRGDDELRGCDYTDQKKTKTMEHHSVPVFAAPFPTEDAHGAFRRGYEIFYATMRQCMTAKNIGMRLQATIVRQIPFFRRPGLCSRSEAHRINLLGFVLIILLN